MRKAISKKTRFEIFKRDEFICQYCGATPPKVVLQVDHIHPVKLGGTNDIDNLITSCQECNLGKSANPLNQKSKKLKDKAKDIAEREEQILGYNKIMQKKLDRIEQDAWRIVNILITNTKSYDRLKFKSIANFIEKLGLYETIDSAEIAICKHKNEYNAFKYFCGVCWRKIKDNGEENE